MELLEPRGRRPQIEKKIGLFRCIRRIGCAHLILLALLCVNAIEAQSSPVKNVVLVHGAWAVGSGWGATYGILVRHGYHVSIVHKPETSFKEDVHAARRVLTQPTATLWK